MSIDEDQDPADIQMKARILELFLPPHNKRIKEIAMLVNRSRSFVYQKMEELVDDGQLERLPSGHLKRVLPESQAKGYSDVMKEDFDKYKSVERWIYRMKRDKVKGWAYQVTNLFKIFKTLKRVPDHFLAPLEQVDQMMEEFDEKFRKGESYYVDENNIKKKKVKDMEDVSIATYVKAVRSFRQKLGHPVPKGLGGILSVSEEKGKYARYKLTDTQRHLGSEFMATKNKKHGDLFTLHHEVGWRTDTLFQTLAHNRAIFKRKIIEVLDPKTNKNIVCEIYIVEEVVEQKQEKAFDKIIMTPEGRRVVRKILNGEQLIEGKADWKAKKAYNNHLREFYRQVGHLKEGTDFKKGEKDYFLQEYPSHFIRHSWSHWLMRCCGYNASVVANFGWEDTETLTKIYAEQSVDDLLNIGNCDFCRPTSNKDPDMEVFCCLQHAIAFYNQQDPPKESEVSKSNL